MGLNNAPSLLAALRNDNQPPAVMDDLFRTLADRLARRGMASLRYDKRGMDANGAEMPHGVPAMTEFFQWDHFVADADAAVRCRPSMIRA